MTREALAEYQHARELQLSRNEARHIHTQVHVAREAPHLVGMRWPFELLQNALDAGPRPGRSAVTVTLHQNEGKTVFEHDGAPFSSQELAALLSGGSSKDFGSEETTGRFGTGFLVTHVLSEHTSLQGLLSVARGYERFRLNLDRSGDEDAILENIELCSGAIEKAEWLSTAEDVPSARFEYPAADSSTLGMGTDAFRTALPYLYGTSPRLGRAGLRVRTDIEETWVPEPAIRTDLPGGYVEDRLIEVRGGTSVKQYRILRFSLNDDSLASALVLLELAHGRWEVGLPAESHARIYRQYPLNASNFIPIEFVIDGRFEPDPERSVALMNESDKQVMSQGLGAAVIAVGYALDQGWRNAHLLARADSPASGFNPADLDETTWWRNELRAFVEKLGELPIVETSTGRLPGLESELADAHVDFISPRLLEGSGAEDTSVDRMWLLFEQATKLDPPSRTLAADWSRIADGWASLDAEPQRLTVQALAGWVRGTARGGPAASNIAELQVDGDRYAWLARYIDIVGECWQRRSGVETSVLDGMLPNQRGILRSPHQLRIDVDVSDELKDICEAVGLDVRAGLLSTELTSSIESLSLGYATPALAKAVTNVAHENHIINELLAYLIKLLPEDTDCSDENLKAQRGTALFLRYLWKTGGENMSAVAHKVPLVAESKKIVYWSPERVMMAPVSSWGESARAFSAAYPQDRILDNLYTTHDDVVVAALTAWGMAYADPIIKSSPSSLDGERLAKMVLDDFDSAGVIVRGAEFSQIALLPREVINHIQDPEQARALLGLVLMHVAPNDEGWRQRRRVNGFRARENIDVPIGGALWVGDLRSRAWIPIRGEDDKPVAKAGADVSTLRPLLEPSWLDGNDQAIALLTQCFEFDELELRLLGIAPEAQVRVRQGLARLLESGGADPEFYEALARDAESKQLRKRDIERCKRMGYAVQDAIGQALESHGLQVRLVDYGFDFEVTGEVGDETFEDMAVGFPVGPYFVEVKATTSGPVRLTSAQADKAASVATRYVLCVVDLREVPDERLDQEWSGTDVEPLASMLSDIGGRIVGTWDLVQRARDSEVGIRNETALRYEVPPYVWMTGVAISQWIAAISEDPQIRA